MFYAVLHLNSLYACSVDPCLPACPPVRTHARLQFLNQMMAQSSKRLLGHAPEGNSISVDPSLLMGVMALCAAAISE